MNSNSRKRSFTKNMKEFWRRYKRNRLAVAALVIVVVALLTAVLGPFFTKDPFTVSNDTFQPPSRPHPMGTDMLGRDILSMIVHGASISLMTGVLAATISTVIGILVGGFSGFFGGNVDDLLMRVTEMFLVMPQFFLALLLAAFFGSSIWNVIFVIGILSWPSSARLVRAQFLSLKEREFTTAARALGCKNNDIIFNEILPNAAPPIIVDSSLQVASAIILEASLSFLGLGDPNVVSWGYMLFYAQRFLSRSWWMLLFPGMSIFLTVFSLNIVGDGLNDALNPRLKER